MGIYELGELGGIERQISELEEYSVVAGKQDYRLHIRGGAVSVRGEEKNVIED